jgi:hypothetical protein
VRDDGFRSAIAASSHAEAEAEMAGLGIRKNPSQKSVGGLVAAMGRDMWRRSGPTLDVVDQFMSFD